MIKSIGIAKNKRYLIDEKGKAFFWLADTWWYGMTSRTSWHDFKILVADRKKKGFTVIQTVIGIPPEINEFSVHTANSGGLPFNKDKSLNYAYFLEVDKKIKYLVDNDLVPCIFGGWGHHIDKLGLKSVKLLWREIVNRYAKYPVVFCLCGEADIFPPVYSSVDSPIKKLVSMFPSRVVSLLIKLKQILDHNNLIKKKNILLSKRLKKWNEIACFVKKIDPYKRLLTVHIQSRTTAAKLFDNPNWLDIDTIQSGHSKESLGFMKSAIKEAAKNKKPIINLEPWYEGILGDFGKKEQLQAFYACMKAGAAGHSYGAHGIWQMATKEDNFMGHWGKSDWKKAINYPGGTALGEAKSGWELI